MLLHLFSVLYYSLSAAGGAAVLTQKLLLLISSTGISESSAGQHPSPLSINSALPLLYSPDATISLHNAPYVFISVVQNHGPLTNMAPTYPHLYSQTNGPSVFVTRDCDSWWVPESNRGWERVGIIGKVKQTSFWWVVGKYTKNLSTSFNRIIILNNFHFL